MEKHHTILVLAVLLIGIARQTFAQTCPKNEAAALAEDPSRNCRTECTTTADCTGDLKSCNCDDDCGMSCFNPDADCDPLTLTDGAVTYSDGQNYNSEATHTCNSGFYLSGQKVRKCRSTKEWSHSHIVPNCTKGCLTPSANLGNAFLLDGEIPGASAYPVGHVITYQCRTGYIGSGDFTRTCQADFQWTNAQFTCTIVSCGAPPSISDGSHSGTNNNFGGTVTYSCDPGYDLNGQASFQCRSAGLWEPEDSWPTCDPVPCLAPIAPDNGGVTYSSSHVFGDVVTYNCDRGYVLNGPETGTCSASGDWGTVPTCNVTLDADFDSGLAGYTVVNGSWARAPVGSGSQSLPTTVLRGNGIVRSLSYPLTGDKKVCMEAAVSKIGANELKAEAYNGASTKFLFTFTATVGTSWSTEKFWLVPVESTDTTVQLQFFSTNTNAELDNIKQLDAAECAHLPVPGTDTTTPTPTTAPSTAPSTEPTTTPDDETTTTVTTTTAAETTTPASTTAPSVAPSTTTTSLAPSNEPTTTPDDERTTPGTSTTADEPDPPGEATTPQPGEETTTTTTTTVQPGATTTTASTTTSATTSAPTTTPGPDGSTQAPDSGLAAWAIVLIVIFSVGFLAGGAFVLVKFVISPASAKTYTAGSNGVTPVETPESPKEPVPASTEL